MISKQELKFVRSLSQKKFRDENSMFIIEGEKMLIEAEKSGAAILKVYYRDQIGVDNMAKISQLSSPPPLLAVVKMDDSFSEVPPNPEKLQLAIDNIKDPGNLGTIIRIADWFGIDDIYLSSESVEVYNPKCVQSTMGALFRVRVHYVNLSKLIENCFKSMPVYGTFLGSPSIYDLNLEPRGIIVMGSESDGISTEVQRFIKNKITIPPFPSDSKRSESLNVAVATAVVCSEFRRLSLFGAKPQTL
ncbi:RNA methyltransferase [Bacteroidales bacterium MB20-C3-3]|nr:RNA methyltransferase [Bacteroidales bacterium MB20-C3-3]